MTIVRQINYFPFHTVWCTHARAPHLCSSLQHSPSKHRHNHHGNNPQPSLANLRHRKPSRSASASTSTCTGSTRTYTTRSRAGASSRRTSRRSCVVSVTEDGPWFDAILHEAVLQIRHALLDAQAVVSTVAVEGFDGRRFAAFFEDGGGVGGESRGGAADGAGDV